MIIKLSAEATGEMIEAAAWYDDREPGLGAEFFEACDRAFKLIAQDPQRHMHVGLGFHRYLMPRFPYAVFYEVRGDWLVIVSVFHGACDPARWQRRLGMR